MPVSACLPSASTASRSAHQVGRKVGCVAMMRNQGDQRSPVPGSIMAWSSEGDTHLTASTWGRKGRGGLKAR